MPTIKPSIIREVFILRRLADQHPIISCDAPPSPRHQLIFRGGAIITFTRNKENGAEAYYLSIKHPHHLPSAAVLNYLASLFFDQDIPIQELFDIKTPGVRCLRQEITPAQGRLPHMPQNIPLEPAEEYRVS